MRNILIAFVIIIVCGVGWYALSPLSNNIKVDEALPSAQPKENTPAQETSLSESVPVVDTPAHPASGQVRIARTGDKTYIRYENYKTINGPDLEVWLAKDLKGSEYVSLGLLKATEGNINYEIPQGVDITQYPYVLTWCEDFSVLFNSADLSQLHTKK